MRSRKPLPDGVQAQVPARRRIAASSSPGTFRVGQRLFGVDPQVMPGGRGEQHAEHVLDGGHGVGFALRALASLASRSIADRHGRPVRADAVRSSAVRCRKRRSSRRTSSTARASSRRVWSSPTAIRVAGSAEGTRQFGHALDRIRIDAGIQQQQLAGEILEEFAGGFRLEAHVGQATAPVGEPGGCQQVGSVGDGLVDQRRAGDNMEALLLLQQASAWAGKPARHLAQAAKAGAADDQDVPAVGGQHARAIRPRPAAGARSAPEMRGRDVGPAFGSNGGADFAMEVVAAEDADRSGHGVQSVPGSTSSRRPSCSG
jgi:hypothetical protein